MLALMLGFYHKKWSAEPRLMGLTIVFNALIIEFLTSDRPF